MWVPTSPEVIHTGSIDKRCRFCLHPTHLFLWQLKTQWKEDKITNIKELERKKPCREMKGMKENETNREQYVLCNSHGSVTLLWPLDFQLVNSNFLVTTSKTSDKCKYLSCVFHFLHNIYKAIIHILATN